MPELSINELSLLTGKTRATVTKSLGSMPFKDGTKGAKLYDSKAALAKLYGASEEDGATFITNTEAQRQLTISRKEEIVLGMEVTRKTRIPLSIVEDVNDRALSNVAGLLKAHIGQQLTDELTGDIFTELRGVGAALKEALKS